MGPDVKVRGERMLHQSTHIVGGDSRARGPWGPLGPDVKVRGESILHERMHPT